MAKSRTKLQRINRNHSIHTFATFLLATSLAFTGTGMVDLFSIESKFSLRASVLFILIGCLTLSAACAMHRLKESEDDDTGEGA